MRVHDIGHEGWNCTFRDATCSLTQSAKAEPIIRPVLAGRIAIYAAIADVEMRCINDEKIKSACVAGKQLCGTAEQIGEFENDLRILQCIHHFGIAGHERAHCHALRLQGSG